MANKKNNSSSSKISKSSSKVANKPNLEASSSSNVSRAESSSSVRNDISRKLFVQFWGKEFDDEQLFKIAEECYQADGNKDKVKDVKLYVKPEESKAYFIVNDKYEGNVVLY